MQTKLIVLGKPCERSLKAPIWRASRWPFSGSVLETTDKRYSWRLKLHPSFQSTEILFDGVADTAEDASEELTAAARRHVKALLWYEETDDDYRDDDNDTGRTDGRHV